MSKVLLQRFLDSVPAEFVKHLLERQLSIYQQAMHLAFDEQPWSEIEAITLMPYIRRALFESEFRKAAIQSGLKTHNSDHVAKNSTCVLVKAGGIILTGHCVEGPEEFVREAESRKQNAGVNKWLNHYVDSRWLTAPIPKLDERPIYINVLHGAWFSSRRTGAGTVDPASCFIRFAIPAADSNKYLAGCNWSAQELLAMYAPATAAEPTAKSIPDEAKPSIKKKA